MQRDGAPPSKHTNDKYLTPLEDKAKKRKNASRVTTLERQLRRYKAKETAQGRTVVLNPDENQLQLYEEMYNSCVVGDKKQQMQQFLNNPENKCEHMKEFFQEQLVLSEKVTRNSKLKNGHRWGSHPQGYAGCLLIKLVGLQGIGQVGQSSASKQEDVTEVYQC